MKEEYTQQQIDCLKQTTHRGIMTGGYYRITEDSTLAEFLWVDQGLWQKSNVTKDVILNSMRSNKPLYEEWKYVEE